MPKQPVQKPTVQPVAPHLSPAGNKTFLGAPWWGWTIFIVFLFFTHPSLRNWVFDIGTGGGTTSAVAVRSFIDSWVKYGVSSAVGCLDSRTPDSMKEVVRSMSLKSWDGKIETLGENTWTVLDTGNQYDVREYRVDPVVNFGGTFVPVTIVVSVAKDSGKVFAVKADLSSLP